MLIDCGANFTQERVERLALRSWWIMDCSTVEL